MVENNFFLGKILKEFLRKKGSFGVHVSIQNLVRGKAKVQVLLIRIKCAKFNSSPSILF